MPKNLERRPERELLPEITFSSYRLTCMEGQMFVCSSSPALNCLPSLEVPGSYLFLLSSIWYKSLYCLALFGSPIFVLALIGTIFFFSVNLFCLFVLVQGMPQERTWKSRGEIIFPLLKTIINLEI